MPELELDETPRAASAKVPESPLRIGLYLAGGAVAVYLATWVGPAAFFLEFQKPLAARELGPDHSVLWLEPQAAGGAPGEGAGAGTELDGLDDEGVTVMRHPEGFLSSLLEEKLEALGVKAEGGLRDAAVLEVVARESLRGYDFGAPEPDRQRYAARLLAKMSLWDLRPVKRFELALREGSCAALVEYAAGDAKVIAATGGETIVVLISAQAPAAWKDAPARWLR